MKKPNSNICVKRWDGLFALWKCGNDHSVTLQPELMDRLNLLRAKASVAQGMKERRNLPALGLTRVFERVEVGSRYKGDLVASNSWSEGFATEVYADLIESVGPLLTAIRSAKDLSSAKNAAAALRKCCELAANLMVQRRTPEREDLEYGVALNARLLPVGSSKRIAALKRLDKMEKAIPAIEMARTLCEEMKRLPTKLEVMQRLKEFGFNYSESSKDIPGLWARTFLRAGLERLPE